MIIHADITELKPADLPPFAAVITDPPYSEHVHANTTSIGVGGRGVRRRDLGFAHATEELRRHVAVLSSGAQRWSAVFSDVESAHLWRDAMTAEGLEYLRTVPWVRWSQPQLSGDRPPTGCELVTLYHPKGAKRWNGGGGLTHFDQGPHRTKGKHSAQKPIDLMLALVSAFSDPGELVVDWFAGSGTTLLAARLLGREALGFECDATWAKRATARLCLPLTDYDFERAVCWAIATREEAARVPAPKKPEQQRTWERAQRRLADAYRILRSVAGVA